MYTKELYKSVAVNERSVTGNEDSSEEFKRENSEVGDAGEVGSGADAVEFEKIGARSGYRLKIVCHFVGSQFDHLQFRKGIRRDYRCRRDLITSPRQ